MPPQVTCASALPGKTGKHKNYIFSFFTQSDCVTHTQCTCALSSWKKKLSSVMCFIASNICRDSKISLMLSIDFHSRLDEEQLPSFTQRLTPWQTWLIQNMWVTDSRMLCSLPRSCVVHPFDRFDSEEWFSSNQVMFLSCFVFFFGKKACNI